MKNCRFLWLMLFFALSVTTFAQTELRHLDVDYSNELPTYPNTKEGKEAWLQRAVFLRQQILASAGLSPLPAKTPLNAQVFG